MHDANKKGIHSDDYKETKQTAEKRVRQQHLQLTGKLFVNGTKKVQVRKNRMPSIEIGTGAGRTFSFVGIQDTDEWKQVLDEDDDVRMSYEPQTRTIKMNDVDVTEAVGEHVGEQLYKFLKHRGTKFNDFEFSQDTQIDEH
jgi:hypothetical protein